MIGRRVDVLTQPQFGNQQFHIGQSPNRSTPGLVPRDTRVDDPKQTGLGGYLDEPETVDEMLEQIIENGMEVMQ